MPYPTSSLMPPRTWTQPGSTVFSSTLHVANLEQEHFFISTDSRLMSAKAVNAAFAQDFIYWGKALPEDVTQRLLDGSLCFGVFRYKHPASEQTSQTTEIEVPTIPPQQLEQIGLARLITDTVTFAWLTDVYILPEYQSRGLGSWMMKCVRTTLYAPGNDGMPFLRRVMLVTTRRDVDGGRLEDYYKDMLGMKVVGYDEWKAVGRSLSVMTMHEKPDVDAIA